MRGPTYKILCSVSMFIHSMMISPGPLKAQPDRQQSFQLAGIQMNVTDDIQKNKEEIIRAIRKAGRSRVDFLVTPEGSLSGYTSQFDQDKLLPALREVTAVAREFKVGLMLGTCYKESFPEGEFCYNQVRLYSPMGEFMGAYSKILRCSPLAHPGTGEMIDFVEGKLKTFEWQGRKFGVLICNDLWATPGYTTIPNPYLAWKLKQDGAEFIIHCINSGTDQRYQPFHESSAELWAFSLKIPIMEVNAAQESKAINARSGLINSEGVRDITVPDSGTQFFIIRIPEITDGTR